MHLMREFGEMWARNSENIEDENIPGRNKGGQGVYILYEGSTPVYIGKGNIRQRLRGADESARRGSSWNYFSWYVIKDKSLIHDVEVLLLRMLPPHLRRLNRQRGHFRGVHSTDPNPKHNVPKQIDYPRLMKRLNK